MQNTSDILQQLQAPADAALAWLNAERNSAFELTGLVDQPAAVDASSAEPFELGLVLCDGEKCAREQVQVKRTADGYEFKTIELAEPAIPPLLDPPAGLRRDWIDEQLGKFKFILLLFYRGRW